MKFGRSLKIMLCLVVAFSLVSLPAQRSDAIVGVSIAAGLAIGSFVTFYVCKAIMDSGGSVSYQTPTWKFMEDWMAEGEDYRNNVDLCETNGHNMVEMLEGQNLYWQRVGERAVTDAVNHSTWDAYMRNVATEEFDRMIYNLTVDALLHPYTLTVTEMVVEANAMSDYAGIFPAPDCTAELRAVTAKQDLHNYTLAGAWHDGDGWRTREMEAVVAFGPVSWGGSSYVPPGYVEPLPDQNHTMFARVNYSRGLDVGSWLQNDLHVIYSVVDGSGAIKTQDNSLSRMAEPQGGWDACPESYRQENLSIQFNNGSAVNVSNLVWGGQALDWKPDLIGQYNRIRTNILNAAYSWWSYLRSQGYTNASEIPADMIPVYPDIALDNVDALGDISRDDAAAIYFSIMSQLDDQTLIQNGTLNPDDFKIGDYRGKMANLTIRYHHDDTVETVVEDSLAYIIPYGETVEVQANTTYLVQNGTGSNVWNQHLGVYTTRNGRFYTLRPGSYYEIIVGSLYEAGEAVGSYTLEVEDVGNFTRSEWGFTLTGVAEPVFTFAEEEGPNVALIAAGLVGGAGLYAVGAANSKKYGWLKTVGLLVMIASLGYAGYVYVWQPLTSLSPFGGLLT